MGNFIQRLTQVRLVLEPHPRQRDELPRPFQCLEEVPPVAPGRDLHDGGGGPHGGRQLERAPQEAQGNVVVCEMIGKLVDD